MPPKPSSTPTDRALSQKPSLGLLRSLTEEHILRALMEQRRLTRAEIATRTGISKPTISQGVQRLAAAGLIHDTGERSRGRGRVGSYYALAPDSGVALVIGIKPGDVVAEAYDPYGERVGRTRVDLPRNATVEQAEAALVDVTSRIRATIGQRVRVAAISAADPVDRATGRLVPLPDSPFPIGAIDPPAALADQVEGPFVVDNDVNWAARAERHRLGADRDDDFVYLHLGDGLGCAVISDGEVRRGHGGIAGEISHVITTGPDGRAMRLIDVFAELGLRHEGSTGIDVDRLLSVAAAPDQQVTTTIIAAAVAGALSAAVALVDPAFAIIGGEWGRDERVLRAVREELAQAPRPLEISAASLTDQPDLIGARNTALDRLREEIVAAAGS